MKKASNNTATHSFLSLLKVVEDKVNTYPVNKEYYQTELEKELLPLVPVGFVMFIEEKVALWQHLPDFNLVLGHSVADYLKAKTVIHATFMPFCYKRGTKDFHRYIRITVVAEANL